MSGVKHIPKHKEKENEREVADIGSKFYITVDAVRDLVIILPACLGRLLTRRLPERAGKLDKGNKESV